MLLVGIQPSMRSAMLPYGLLFFLSYYISHTRQKGEQMPDREKVIEAWEIFRDSNPYEICEGKEFRATNDPEYCMGQMITDTIELLKEQEGKVTVPFSWLVKFCSHIDFKEPMYDSEREQAWKEKLKQQFGIDV